MRPLQCLVAVFAISSAAASWPGSLEEIGLVKDVQDFLFKRQDSEESTGQSFNPSSNPSIRLIRALQKQTLEPVDKQLQLAEILAPGRPATPARLRTPAMPHRARPVQPELQALVRGPRART